MLKLNHQPQNNRVQLVLASSNTACLVTNPFLLQSPLIDHGPLRRHRSPRDGRHRQFVFGLYHSQYHKPSRRLFRHHHNYDLPRTRTRTATCGILPRLSIKEG